MLGNFKSYPSVLKRYLSRYDAMGIISDLVQKEPVVVFMKGSPQKPACGWSSQMCSDLVEEGELEKFAFVDVMKYPIIRETVKDYSLYPNIPQVFVRGKFLGGCDKIRELKEKGLLREELLTDKENVQSD